MAAEGAVIDHRHVTRHNVPPHGGVETHPEATTNPRRTWVLIAMSLGFTMTMIDATIVAVALPSIQDDLGLTSVERTWVVNSYLLVLAATIAAAGRFSDVLGQKRVFLVGVVIFTLASAGCGAAPNGTVLILFRAIEGFGAALMTPTSQAIVSDAYPAKERGRALGIYAGVSSAGVALGPILGGLLTGFLSWRWIFYVNLPLGVLTVLLTLHANPADRREGGRIDWAGLVTLVLGLSGVVIALMQSSTWGLVSTEFLIVLGVGVALLALFVMIELRAQAPIIDMHLFRNRNFLGDNLNMFIVRFALFGMAVYSPIFVQDVLGLSPQVAGFASLPATVMLLALSPAAGKMYDRLGIRPMQTWGLVLAAVGFLWISLVGFPKLDYWWLVPGFVVAGAGIALNMSPTMTDTMNSSPPDAKGQAAGILGTTQQMGGTFGIAVLTAVITPLAYLGFASDLSARGVDVTPSQVESALATYTATGDVPTGVTPSDVDALKESFADALSMAFLIIVALLVIGLVIARTVPRNIRYGASGPVLAG